MYTLGEEHELLRRTARELAEAKIAPFAAEVDANSRFPAEAIAAQALGIAQGALDYAVGYVRERRQFGRAIADFQGIQFMLADMAMRLEAARQLTYHAAALSERAMGGEQVPSLTFVLGPALPFGPISY